MVVHGGGKLGGGRSLQCRGTYYLLLIHGIWMGGRLALSCLYWDGCMNKPKKIAIVWEEWMSICLFVFFLVDVLARSRFFPINMFREGRNIGFMWMCMSIGMGINRCGRFFLASCCSIPFEDEDYSTG